MNFIDARFRHVPEYYNLMYWDGFTPEEIMYAHRRSMLQSIEERQTVENIHITSEIKVK